MDNQHRQIKGYRELTQDDINMMNEIKQKGAELGELIHKLEARQQDIAREFRTGDAEPYRWISIGKTHLQQGLMALTRAVAKPEFF